jgi:hypothetical protein
LQYTTTYGKQFNELPVFINRTYYIAITIPVSRKAILIVRLCTPTVITAQTTLRKIHIEHDLATRLYIGVVHLLLREARVEILGAVRHCADAQRL